MLALENIPLSLCNVRPFPAQPIVISGGLYSNVWPAPRHPDGIHKHLQLRGNTVRKSDDLRELCQ